MTPPCASRWVHANCAATPDGPICCRRCRTRPWTCGANGTALAPGLCPNWAGRCASRAGKAQASPARACANAGLSLRLRQGGEKLRLQAKGSTRSLKNLLQEACLPPWERERLPLVYCADTLVAVPGLGVASGWEAGAGEAGWLISWRPQA